MVENLPRVVKDKPPLVGDLVQPLPSGKRGEGLKACQLPKIPTIEMDMALSSWKG